MENTLNRLVIYRNLAEDPLLQIFLKMLQGHEVAASYYALLHELLIKGTTLYQHIVQSILLTENTFTYHLEQAEDLQTLDALMLINDLAVLKILFEKDLKLLARDAGDDQNMLYHLRNSAETDLITQKTLDFFLRLKGRDVTTEDCVAFSRIIKRYGIGAFAFHQAFYFSNDHQFMPIKDFHPITWEYIYSYQDQKQQLYENTAAFLKGAPFHNALLVGSSGTGKSSSVKALIPQFAPNGLRLIQMHKGQLNHLPKVLSQLSGRIFKFIVFIDDLSFEANEDEYKFLKSFIEGGVANSAENVVFYITSNRRHLIKEIRSERENDIHLNDFIQAMTSLSDRFGLTLFYEAPNQPTYFDMIVKMLEKYELHMTTEEISIKARQWSLEHGGMSGRTAEQFAKHMKMKSME